MPNEFGSQNLGNIGLLTKAYAAGLRNLALIDQTVEKESSLLQFFKGPNFELDEEYIEIFTRAANPGFINAPLDATIPTTRGEYNRYADEIKWDHYWFSVTDQLKEKALQWVLDQEAIDSVRFYSNVTDWKIITELVSKAGTTNAAANGVWSTAANAEQDIIKGLQDLAYNTGIPHVKAPSIIILYPTKVFTSIEGLDFIHNMNQSLKKYLGEAYNNLYFIDFTPAFNASGSRVIDMKGNSSDALTTNALVMYGGMETLRVGEYIPKNIPRVETGSLGVFKGAMTATRRCFGCLGVGMFGATTTKRVVKITNVTT